MPPNTVRILGAAITGKIFLDIGSFLDSLIELEHAVVFSGISHLLHRLGEGEFRSINALLFYISLSF